MDGADVGTQDAALASLHETAIRYCEAVWFARTDVFEAMCHERFNMTLVTAGSETAWTKQTFIDRVAGRKPFEGPASYEILDLDVAGGEIGRVHLWVDVPPHRYEDHLGFVRTDGTWKLLTKVFRTKEILHGDTA
jgi:hypothetical protein